MEKLTVIYVEELSQNMYCISSVIENVIIKMSENIPIYSYYVTIAYNGIFIIMYLKTPALDSIFSDTWSWSIFFLSMKNLYTGVHIAVVKTVFNHDACAHSNIFLIITLPCVLLSPKK